MNSEIQEAVETAYKRLRDLAIADLIVPLNLYIAIGIKLQKTDNPTPPKAQTEAITQSFRQTFACLLSKGWYMSLRNFNPASNTALFDLSITTQCNYLNIAVKAQYTYESTPTSTSDPTISADRTTTEYTVPTIFYQYNGDHSLEIANATNSHGQIDLTIDRDITGAEILHRNHYYTTTKLIRSAKQAILNFSNQLAI